MTENRALPENWHNHDGYRAIFNAALTGICANPAFFGAIYQGSPAGAVKFASDVLAAALTFTASLSGGEGEGEARPEPARERRGDPSPAQPADALRSGKWRKRPVVIDAFRLGHDPMPDWFCDKRSANEITTHNVDDRWRGGPDVALIKTLEGTMRAEYGDWIIRGVQGEVYPCKPDIFAETYEPADGSQVEPSTTGAGRQIIPTDDQGGEGT